MRRLAWIDAGIALARTQRSRTSNASRVRRVQSDLGRAHERAGNNAAHPRVVRPVHHDLLAELHARRGLVLVAGPTGQGKTTVIDEVLALPACPSSVIFVGDVRDAKQAQEAVSLARSSVVVAVLRIPRAAGAFVRLRDMQVPVTDLTDVVRVAFSVRLVRPPSPRLLHERLVVSDPIRALILAGADPVAIHRQALADGMRSLRQTGQEHVDAGRLSLAEVVEMTPDDST